MTSSPSIPANPTPTPTPTPDTTPPTSTITFPTEGAVVAVGTQVAITGAASDAGGGSVVKVEVSVDGGASYSAAMGTNAWSFNWTPSAPGPVTIKSRAVDNSGNVQNPPTVIHVTKTPITIKAPSEQPTIQAAIDVAIEGDTVLVAPGTYPENINFGGKAIIVRSQSGPEVNNTIADNNATSAGSGIFAEGHDARTELTNNIIVAKPGQTGLHCGNLNNQNQAIIRNNIFSSGGIAYGGACVDRTGTDGNISADPLFTDPTQGDYHLQLGSPSIDAGDNLTPNLPGTDLDGDPRILDGDGNGTAIVDMGVDEFRLPFGLKISLLDESDPGSKNSRALFICNLRPWAKTSGRRSKNSLSALPPHSPRLRVK